VISKVLDCFFLLRIPLLAPVWTILILGWITGNPQATLGGSLASGGNNGEAGLWIALGGFSLIVASIYVVNQIVDIESDRINHKLFLLPHGFVRPVTAWVLAAVCALGGMTTSLYLGAEFTLLFAAGLVLGCLYNLPPVHLKNRPWGGVLANVVGHGILTYLVGWYAAKMAVGQTAEFTEGLRASLAPGFANAAVFLATTIPDAGGDGATGKRTFCVAFGEKKTALAAAVACAAALAATFMMQYHAWIMAVPTAISLVLFVYHAVAPREELAFQTFKWPVFLLSAVVALMVPIYGVLILATFFGSRAYYRRRFGIDYPTFESK
jgi:4-hydroxybenzoate polyprenyltransferase